MNKFIWSLVLILYFLICYDQFNLEHEVNASSYNSFSEVTLESGKLLCNYTDSEYDKYYEEVLDRKFFGWNTLVVNKEVKANFIEKTVLEVTNDKDSAVDYKYQITSSSENRTILDCSGTLGYEVKGEIKKFKNDLNAKINIGYKEENTNYKKTTEELKISCDANTKLLITIKGTAVVTNGVCAYYFCFGRTILGGYEYFTITHEFQSIEKVAYEEN